MRWLDGITDSMEMRWEMAMDREAWNAAVHWDRKENNTTEQLNNKASPTVGLPWWPRQ